MKSDRHRKPWLPAEDALVRRNVIPEGRTLHATKHRARALGVKFSMDPHWRWTDREKELILRHVVPRGRTLRQSMSQLTNLGYRAKGIYHAWKYEGIGVTLHRANEGESER